MNVVRLLLISELALGIDYLAIIPLSVVDVLSSTHNGNIYLTATSDNVIPVDEVDVSEETKVELAVLDCERLASAEEAAAEVTVCIHA